LHAALRRDVRTRARNARCCIVCHPMANLKEMHMASDTNSTSSNGGPIRKFIDVQKALKGASYPADKASLLDTAKGNGADDEVLDALERLPEQEYGSPAEVSKGVGNE
jgi:hypothetical protein